MFWRKKQQPFQDDKLGTLTFSYSQWDSEDMETPAGTVVVSVDGDRSAPDPDALRNAHEALPRLAELRDEALAFINSDAHAIEFMEHNGSPCLDGFSFTATTGEFAVNFGLTQWPDAMLNVQYVGGKAVEVWLGD